MKKLFLILSSVFLIFNSSFAQMPSSSPSSPSTPTVAPSIWGGQKQYAVTGKITGTLIDSSTRQPVEFATVTLTKKNWRQVFGGSITDGKGYFKLDKVLPGTYSVTISFVGYNTKVIDSVRTSNEKLDASMGKIYFSPTVTDLKEVEVAAQKSLIENKVDRLIYNAEKDLSSKGGDASDVLRKVPMLSIDANGNVALRGSSAIKILINGKPSGMMANNVADALKAIPADQIKSVEVITSPSAKYDAEGTAGIVNIITKKNNLQGMNGNVNVSVGTRSNSLNGNLNIKKGRTVISSSAWGNYNLPRNGYSTFRSENYSLTDTFVFQKDGDFKAINKNLGGSLGIDYDFNAFNNISSAINVYNYGNSRKTEATDSFFNNGLLVNQYFDTTQNTDNSIDFDFNLDYRKTSPKKGEEFTISLLYNQSEGKSDYTLEQIFRHEKSESKGVEREGTLQADYVLPIKKKWILETGAKGILRDISSNYNYKVLVNDSYEEDPTRTNRFNYLQGVYSGYAVLGYVIKDKYEDYRDKYQMKGGLRYEYTDNKGEFASGTNKVKNGYGNLFPSFVIATIFDNYSNLKLSYSKRLQRPGLYNLDPFEDASDPNNISKGNPYLSPELSQTVEFAYGKFAEKKSYNISLYYKYTDSVIQQITDVNNGLSTTTFHNIGNDQNIGLNIYGQVELWDSLTIRGSGNVYYLYQRGINTITNAPLSNEDIQYNIYGGAELKLGKGFTAYLFGNFNSRELTLQGKVPSFTFMGMGMTKTIWKKKGTIGLQIFNPFNEYLKFKTDLKEEGKFKQSSEIKVPFRTFSITFSYKFGKLTFDEKDKGVNNDDMKKEEQKQY